MPKKSCGMIGKRGHAQQLGERLQVAHGHVLLLGADHRHGHDGRPGLEREAHETKAERGHLVALIEGLTDAARALGEDHQALLVLEQAASVAGLPTTCPTRGNSTDTKGSSAVHFSTMLRGKRGGSASIMSAVAIIMPSSGICPEWFAMTSKRPSSGTFSMPCTSVRK
jgi:hypothetical protein